MSSQAVDYKDPSYTTSGHHLILQLQELRRRQTGEEGVPIQDLMARDLGDYFGPVSFYWKGSSTGQNLVDHLTFKNMIQTLGIRIESDDDLIRFLLSPDRPIPYALVREVFVKNVLDWTSNPRIFESIGEQGFMHLDSLRGFARYLASPTGILGLTHTFSNRLNTVLAMRPIASVEGGSLQRCLYKFEPTLDDEDLTRGITRTCSRALVLYGPEDDFRVVTTQSQVSLGSIVDRMNTFFGANWNLDLDGPEVYLKGTLIGRYVIQTEELPLVSNNWEISEEGLCELLEPVDGKHFIVLDLPTDTVSSLSNIVFLCERDVKFRGTRILRKGQMYGTKSGLEQYYLGRKEGVRGVLGYGIRVISWFAQRGTYEGSFEAIQVYKKDTIAAMRSALDSLRISHELEFRNRELQAELEIYQSHLARTTAEILAADERTGTLESIVSVERHDLRSHFLAPLQRRLVQNLLPVLILASSELTDREKNQVFSESDGSVKRLEEGLRNFEQYDPLSSDPMPDPIFDTPSVYTAVTRLQNVLLGRRVLSPSIQEINRLITGQLENYDLVRQASDTIGNGIREFLSQRSQLTTGRFNLAEALKTQLGKVKLLQGGVDVRVDLPDLEIIGDELALRTAIGNLLVNAFDAVRRGGEERYVYISHSVGDGTVEIVGKNSGFLHEPSFVRELNNPRRGPLTIGGTGLGTLQAHKAALSEGGSLSFVHQETGGLEWRLSLPIR